MDKQRGEEVRGRNTLWVLRDFGLGMERIKGGGDRDTDERAMAHLLPWQKPSTASNSEADKCVFQ